MCRLNRLQSVLFLGFASWWVWAGGRSLTSPTWVPVDATQGQMGGMGFVLRGMDMPVVSSEDPVFIRIWLGPGHVLQETRVDLESATTTNQPIALALFSTDSGPFQVVAPPDTVQIVRWRQGESEIWIQIKSLPATWMEESGNPIGPDLTHTIGFALGINAAVGETYLSPLQANGHANLPNNSVWDGSQWQAQSTAILFTRPAGGEVHEPYPIWYSHFVGSQGVQTADVPGAIVQGSLAPNVFKHTTKGYIVVEPAP